MIYLKEFATQAAYDAAESSLLTPNVALIVANGEVKYKKGTTPPTETRLVCVYEGRELYITDEYIDPSDYFSAMEVDDVELSEVPTEPVYEFETEGEHIVKYTLIDPTTISNSLFMWCAGLTSITIPNSVTSIGNWVFKYSDLSSVIIPNSVTSIGQQAFSDCYNLTSIDIPNSVTNIDTEAFANCGLTSITIPNSVTSISNGTFYQCGNLTNVTIPSSVTSIGDNAFALCDSLANITVNATTPPTLGEYALGYDDDPKNFTIYVPSGSVSVYQAAEGWSAYASRIQPIQ